MTTASMEHPNVGVRVRVNVDATTPAGDRHPFAGRCGLITKEHKSGTLDIELAGNALQLARETVTFLATDELSEDLPPAPVPAKKGKAVKAPASAEQPSDDEPRFMMLPLDNLIASRTNPRTHFDPTKLQELAESIRESGVLQPVTVRVLPAERLQETRLATPKGRIAPSYEIVAGERRFRASVLAERKMIPTILRALTDRQVLEMQLLENVQRDDLTALEEADGFGRLMEETKITAPELAAKIGKSKRYIYARLKLRELCAEARAALAEGKIDASRALPIAVIPDQKLQLKVLAEATAEDWRGTPRHSVRDLNAWINENIMLRLERARFDIKSETVCDGAGACTSCPKRTGANPDLFHDAESADLCTDPACYHGKTEAHDAAEVEKAKQLGSKVIAGTEARELMPYANGSIKGYTKLDDSDYHIGVHNGTVRKALGKACPEPTIVIDPHSGKAVAVVKTSTARRLIGEKKKADAEKKAAKHGAQEAAKPVDQRPEYRTRWMQTVVDSVDATLKAKAIGIPAELLRVHMLNLLQYGDDGAFGPALDLGTEFNYTGARKRLLALDDDQVERTFLRWMLHDTESNTHSTVDVLQAAQPRHPLAIMAAAVDVDIAATQAQVKQQMEGEDRAKAMEAEQPAEPEPTKAPKATKPKAAAKGKTSPPAAPKKATKAEAAASIAEALQQAETTRGPNNFRIGQAVKFKQDLKGPNGKARKVCGRSGTIEAKSGDGGWSVRFGEKKHETAIADYTELEPHEEQLALPVTTKRVPQPTDAWPFPT